MTIKDFFRRVWEFTVHVFSKITYSNVEHLGKVIGVREVEPTTPCTTEPPCTTTNVSERSTHPNTTEPTITLINKIKGWTITDLTIVTDYEAFYVEELKYNSEYIIPNKYISKIHSIAICCDVKSDDGEVIEDLSTTYAVNKYVQLDDDTSIQIDIIDKSLGLVPITFSTEVVNNDCITYSKLV